MELQIQRELGNFSKTSPQKSLQNIEQIVAHTTPAKNPQINEDEIIFKTPTKKAPTPKRQDQILPSPLKSRKNQLKSKVPKRKSGGGEIQTFSMPVLESNKSDHEFIEVLVTSKASAAGDLIANQLARATDSGTVEIGKDNQDQIVRKVMESNWDMDSLLELLDSTEGMN